MRIGDKDMDFNTILAQIAARHNTTPEEVYRQMQISIEDAYQKRFEENGRAALWKELGFEDQCPTPEQFLEKIGGGILGARGLFR